MNESIPPPQPVANTNLTLDNKQQNQIQQQQQLFKLPVGATFNAAVIGGDKNGNALIRFAGNDLVLSSPLALAKGAQLALKVDGTSGTVNLQLLSVDGKLPATQAQANSNQLQQNPQQQGQNQQSPILKLINIAPSNSQAAQAFAAPQAATTQTAQAAQTAPTQAVVVGSASATNAVGILTNPVAEALQGARAQIKSQFPAEQASKILENIPQNLKPNSEVNFKVNNIQPNPAQPAAPNLQNSAIATDNKALKGQEFHQQPNSGQNLQTSNQTTQATAQQPTQTTQQVASEKPNFIPNLQVASDGSIKVSAQVLSSNSSGQLIVETALGKISLNTSLATQKLQPGSILNLQITNFGRVQADIEPAKQHPLQTLANDWPALRELATTLSNAGQNNTLNKLAGLDSIFAARMAGFFNSVKNQNINNWISSELMDVLDDATREQLIGKLRADFSNLGRLANDSGSNWQTFLFPIFDGEELRQAKFHLRYLEDENGEPSQEKGARFVVEFDAGSFGDMQIDGLVRKNPGKNNFDLIIRSHQEIETEVQIGIREIFANAQSLTGFNGSIDFASMPEFPQNIMDEKLARLVHRDDIVEA